jgi:hypothetical protein
MSSDLTVIRVPQPKYGINEIVYFKQSASLGYIECAKVSAVYYDTNIGKNIYLFNFKKSKPDMRTVGDRIDMKHGFTTYMTEDSLLTYIEALQIKANYLRYEYQKSESQLASLVGQPVMIIYGNGHPIHDGDITTVTDDYTDFSSVNIGNSLRRNYEIKNEGESDLLLIGNPLVRISGDDDFTVAKYPDTIIVAGSYSIFGITFAPTVTGRRVASVLINSNVGLYDFMIEGIGI